jgi:glycosyltransferase involved in cell wall biosynthesis
VSFGRASTSWLRDATRCRSRNGVNVLFLTHSFPRSHGDAPGSFLLRLATALKERSVNVHVVAPSAEGLSSIEDMDGIQVERFRYAPRRYEKLAYTGNMAQDVASSWSARLALIGFMGSDFVSSLRARRSFEPDVIHAHWWFPSGVVGSWLARLSHRPLVTTLHGTDVRMARSVAFSRPMFRHVLQHSAKVTTVSSWLASEVTSLVPSVRPAIAPMPADTERYAPGGRRENARLLFVGRFTPQKGLDHLLRALAQMKRPAILDIVGNGGTSERYRALAQELAVTDRVAWHGQLRSDQLAGLYRAATALVVPSIDEGLGLVAVEALLCETPVVAFRSGGLTDVIQDGRTGILVSPGDSAALAAALDSVIAEPERARTLGAAGRLYALSTFAPESAAQRYSDIYAKAVERHAT